MRIRDGPAMPGIVLAAVRHAGQRQAMAQMGGQQGDDTGVGMEGAVTDHSAATPVHVEDRREAEVNPVGTQLGSEHEAEGRGDAACNQHILVPQVSEPPHRRQARESFAEPLNASTFVIDGDQQRRIAEGVDFVRELAQLLRRLEIPREQDHHADQRMGQPVPVRVSKFNSAFEADDHRSYRHAPSSASATA